jgi:ABC-type transport system involved in multi-copper enzyme maturation permease subunit
VRQISLIAANFLREHRWPVLILFAWIFLMAAASGDFGRSRPVNEDVLFYCQQQAMYICVFSAFLAADAIHNERKSRRILLVLSKAVSRGKYLLAVVLGTCTMSVAYALVFALCGIWLTARAALPNGQLWSLVILVMAGSVIAATVAMFFSTFLNPYVATALTVVFFCAPGLLGAQRHAWSIWLPGLPILADFLRFSFRPDWTINWFAAIIAILQAVFFWVVAAAVFNRRDIAVPVE